MKVIKEKIKNITKRINASDGSSYFVKGKQKYVIVEFTSDEWLEFQIKREYYRTNGKEK